MYNEMGNKTARPVDICQDDTEGANNRTQEQERTMPLNLSQTQAQVKTALIPSTLNPRGLSETYRQLKSLGWTSTGRMNPNTHTSVLTLGDIEIANLHKAGKRNTWLITTPDGQTQEFTGSAVEITQHAAEQPFPFQGEPMPGPEVLTEADDYGLQIPF